MKKVTISGKLPDPFGEDEKYPVLMTGDACLMNCESDTVGEARRRGYIVARFEIKTESGIRK